MPVRRFVDASSTPRLGRASPCGTTLRFVRSAFEYLSRAPLGKDTIYYLNASTRQLAEASPHYEAFKASGREVLFVYNTLDDFTLTNISNYNGREIRSAEALKPDDLDLADKADESGDEKKEGEEKAADGVSTLKTKLTDDEAEALCEWLRDALSSKLRDVKTTDRLVGSPAIITQHESATLRKMMQQVDQAHSGTQASLGKQQLEVNAAHPVMVRLHALALNAASDDPAASESAELAQLAAEQVYNGVHMRICLPCPRRVTTNTSRPIRSLTMRASARGCSTTAVRCFRAWRASSNSHSSEKHRRCSSTTPAPARAAARSNPTRTRRTASSRLPTRPEA